MTTLTTILIFKGLGFAIGLAVLAVHAAVRIARDPFARYGLACVVPDRFRR